MLIKELIFPLLKKNSIHVILSAFLLLFSACGGSHSATILDSSAILLDSSVEGVEYVTKLNTGLTDVNGRLRFSSADTSVSFLIGNLKLGDFNLLKLNQDGIITISELLQLDRNNTRDPKIVSMLRFLQSLDNDDNPSNGIVIDQKTRFFLENNIVSSNFSDLNISELNSTIVTKLGKNFVTENQAVEHYELTLKNVFSSVVDTIAPVFQSSSVVLVDENQLTAVSLNASDMNTLTYSLSGTDSNRFDINATTGVVTFKVAPNYETKTSYNFVATASDGINDINQSVTININNIIDVTPSLSSFSASVDENASIGTIVGSVSISSSGDSPITGFTLSNTTNFEINASGTIKTKVAFDYETKTSYSFSIYATNTAGNSTDLNATINIVNIAEIIPVLSDFTASIYEKASIGTVVGSIDITASGDSLITGFTLSDATNFEINASGTIKTKTALSYNTKSSYALSVYATNSAGSSLLVNVTININKITAVIYIISAVYDNNATAATADDKLYVYFNKSIDVNSISTDTSANYEISGTGAIGSASGSDYNDTIFYRHLINQDNGTTGSIAISTIGDTNISLAINTITDTNSNYPVDYNKTVVKKFRALLKTGQVISYVENGDGNTTRGRIRNYTRDDASTIVTDNITGLVWQDNTTPVTKDMTTSMTYCQDLLLGGSADWRLPTIEELVSLSDFGKSTPSIDAVFQNTVSNYYWSSTTYVGDISKAWSVGFSDGYQGFNSKATSNYVRCVRAGQ